MTVRRRKTELILMIQTLMGTVLTMEMTISLKIPMRILTLMGTEREIILILMTMGTVFRMRRKKKMVQNPKIPIPMVTVLMMVKMVSLMTPTKVRIPTGMESVMTKTQMTTGMAFRMRMKLKMEPIPKIPTPTEMGLMTVKKKKMELIPMTRILMAMG